MDDSVRIDKWLWAVRLYKTRSQAAAACAGGHVHIGGQAVKPARSIRIGDVVCTVAGGIKRTVKVLAPLEHRVGAKLVSQFLEDLTPAAEYEKQREWNFAPPPFRPKGAGRPTKKERRTMTSFFGEEEVS